MKPNDNTRAYWREKKRAWRKDNPGKDAEYEKKNTGHNSKVGNRKQVKDKKK